MSAVTFPDALVWDKQKATFAKVESGKLGDELKSLAKLHGGVDFDAFKPEKLSSTEEVQKLIDEIDGETKRKIKAIVDKANAAESVASKVEDELKKEKEPPKVVLVVTAALIRSLRSYGSDVSSFAAPVRTALTARLAKLEAEEKKNAKAGPRVPSKIELLVRSRVTAGMRLAKNHKPGAKPVHFMVCKSRARATAYVAPAVGPSQQKLLRKVLENESPYKFFMGEVVFEKNMYTFVGTDIETGLVKKLQKGLFDLTNIRYRLCIRKANGETEQVEGDDEPEGAAEAAAAAAKDEKAAEAVAKAFMTRLGRMQPLIKKAQAGTASEDMPALVKEMQKAAKDKDYQAAIDALDEIEALLEEADAQTTPPKAPPRPNAPARDLNRLTALHKQWSEARDHAVAEINRLANTIDVEFSREPGQAKAVGVAVKRLRDLAGKLRSDLEDDLGKAIREKDAAKQNALARSAKSRVVELAKLINGEPLMAEIDGNEVLPDLRVVAPMKATLREVALALG